MKYSKFKFIEIGGHWPKLDQTLAWHKTQWANGGLPMSPCYTSQKWFTCIELFAIRIFSKCNGNTCGLLYLQNSTRMWSYLSIAPSKLSWVRTKTPSSSDISSAKITSGDISRNSNDNRRILIRKEVLTLALNVSLTVLP